MDNYDLKAAHNAARFNRDTLVQAGKCGCFYCLKIFTPLEIEEWCPEEEDGEEVTAICPHCGVDSVIGDNCGFPITQEFLAAMHGRWFGKDGINA
ncbi:MAG: cytoplasmic protein [Lawsonibacter sp.]|nr:cytoplasmic protein [Lawsonibacter sp.]